MNSWLVIKTNRACSIHDMGYAQAFRGCEPGAGKLTPRDTCRTVAGSAVIGRSSEPQEGDRCGTDHGRVAVTARSRDQHLAQRGEEFGSDA